MPMAVFMMARVSGMRKISRITKGMARKMLMNTSSSRFTGLQGLIPPSRVMVSTTPKNRPSTKEIAPAIRNICSVASQLWKKRLR